MNTLTAISRFISNCKYTKNLSNHTIRAYEQDLRCFTRFITAEPDDSIWSPQCIHRYHEYLHKECELNTSSIRRRIACLRSFFAWLEREDHLEKNPFRQISFNIKTPTRIPRSLSKYEISKLLAAPLKLIGKNSRKELTVDVCLALVERYRMFRSLTMLLSIDILFATGIRVSELAGMSILDIDLPDQTIRIHGKGDRERLVFIPTKSLTSLIQVYINVRTTIVHEHSFFLISPKGKPINDQYIRILIRNAGHHARIPQRITPHMLRHSAATHLLNAGVEIRYVQRLLGHQSITTTQIYTQVGNPVLKKAICSKHPIRQYSK